jgi:Family of unknown function (DUF6345)
MNIRHQTWFRTGISLFTSLALTIVSLTIVMPTAAGENSMPSGPAEYVSAPAQVSIEPPASPATVQATLPISLPVFQLGAPAVNQDTLQRLAASYSGISPTATLSDTTFAGSLSLRSVNTQTGTSLQQFVATGGFFATNFQRAFSETAGLRLTGYNPSTICSYLQGKSLFPQDFAPSDPKGCTGYRETPIYLSILTPTLPTSGANSPAAAGAISEVVQIGVEFQAPLEVVVGQLPTGGPMYMPLGGPGGHLSLLLTGFGDQESLDPMMTGLNAIAAPMNGRFIQRTIGSYPVVPPQVVRSQLSDRLRSILPAGAVITPGNPGLEYYVDHPAVTQTVIMPMWVFTDATANVGGEEVDLKGLTLPGVEGFLPDVHITSPASNAIYFPGRPLTVTGTISGTAEPFTYTLEVEGGSVLTTGVAPSGTLQLPLNSVPFPIGKGSGDNVVLRLSATDSNGAMSQDSVLLQSPLFVYLPLVLRDATGSSAMSLPGASPWAEAPAQPATAFTMGVEWIQYYNGTNPDLPGVPPDANGFYNRLVSLGWTGRFNWGNNAAWEKDWRDCSLGGIDCTFGVDRAEFAYFSGHGSPARIYFGVNKDAYSFWGGNARFQNVRWAAFSSCQTLRAGPYVGPGNPPLTDWFNSFQGAYMLLGFHSTMGDIAFGGPLIDNMKLPKLFGVIPLFSSQPTIRDAWVMTAFQMNAGKPAYLYAVGNLNPVDYKLPDPAWSFFYPDVSVPLTGIYQFRWVWWNE